MELKLAENLRARRKSLGLTQEQLAEVLNVSVGVISKWELGQSTPDLSIILELADLFEISVDVLLGYQARDKKRQLVLEQLDAWTVHKDMEVDYSQVEQFLLKYPNDFQIAYSCAELYSLKGMEGQEEAKFLRALDLYEKAVSLLEQNEDPAITETSIAVEQGRIYEALGRYEDAAAILKAHNPCGVNDALVGWILAARCDRVEEAKKHLSRGLLKSLADQNYVAQGLMNIYEKQGRYDLLCDVSRWMEQVIDGVRLPGQVSYLDKFQMIFQASEAYALLRQGKGKAAEAALMAARETALTFDADPCYDATRLRFVELERAVAYDGLGIMAMEALACFVSEQKDPAFTDLWESLQ